MRSLTLAVTALGLLSSITRAEGPTPFKPENRAWNLALPLRERRGEELKGACEECTGIVEVDTEKGTYRLTPEFWAFAQLSKFTASGAKELKVTFPETEGLLARAFRNPDGTITAVLVNRSVSSIKLALMETASGTAEQTLPAKTAVTYKWLPTKSKVTNLTAR